MVEKARSFIEREQLSNVAVMQGDIRYVHFESGAFDLIYLVTAIGEIPDREKVLKSLFSLLKPNGRFSITEVIPDPCYQTISTVRRMALSSGFIEEACYEGPLSYTINFKKPAM